MRAGGLSALALVLGAAACVWGFGWDDALARWALDGQREVQGAMAAAVRALRAGEPGALASLAAIAYSYGVFHAVGPGHGKVLIAGYGVASAVRLLRLSAIALGASLAQALSAILLVVVGARLLGLGRAELTGIAEDWLAPASWAAIAGVGLWLALRGLLGLQRAARGGEAHAHSGCGHAHGPSSDEVQRAEGLSDVLVLVASIAVRPCTGALFLLILTFAIGAPMAGILGALAMGLGTATVTIAAGAAAVLLRDGAFLPATGRAAARIMPVLAIGAGLMIATVSAGLFVQSLRYAL